MRHLLVVVLTLGVLAGSAAAQAAPEAMDLTPHVSGVALDVKDGRLTASVAKFSVGTFVTVENFKLSTIYQPGPGLLLSPVTSVLDLTMKDTSMSIARLALNLKPLQDAGVQLPGGFIASLIKAHLEAFDTREISMKIQYGVVSMAAKSGIVHTKLEAAIGWGENSELALRVDAIRLNFGLPIPRSMIMKRLAFLDPLDWADVRQNVVVLHVDRLAKVVAESLPAELHFKLP